MYVTMCSWYGRLLEMVGINRVVLVNSLWNRVPFPESIRETSLKYSARRSRQDGRHRRRLRLYWRLKSRELRGLVMIDWSLLEVHQPMQIVNPILGNQRRPKIGDQRVVVTRLSRRLNQINSFIFQWSRWCNCQSIANNVRVVRGNSETCLHVVNNVICATTAACFAHLFSLVSHMMRMYWRSKCLD